MHSKPDQPDLPHAAPPQGYAHALSIRLRGAGGLYNTGNALGLIGGLVLVLLQSPQGAPAHPVQTLWAYLAGDLGSTALTVSMVLFIWSGELYHRTEHNSGLRARALLQRADFISGIAALVLAVSLTYAGSLTLALTATVLLAGGKLGNAVFPDHGWPVARPRWLATKNRGPLDLFRISVLVSRVPAMTALAIGLVALIHASAPWTVIAQPAILLVCYGLWACADIVLFKAA